MNALRNMQSFLGHLPTGPVPEEQRREIEALLAEAWHGLEGDDGGMEPYKLRGRTENLRWDPPILSFSIERHGGTVMGSSRAEMQAWQVDLDSAEAQCFSAGFRQLHPMQKAVKTGPIAEELAAAIRERRDEPRLQWTKDRRKVRVRISEVFAPAANRTTEGSRRRLARDLEPLLEPHGWQRAGGWWVSAITKG